MSPNINSFVGDLVAMAQAMEELPKAQSRIHDLERQLEEAQRHNQGLEQNILGYKDTIAHWQDQAKVLTDQRDNAELRAMELEDRNNAVSRFLGTLMGEANSLRNVIDPPTPEPDPWPTPVHSDGVNPDTSTVASQDYSTSAGDPSPSVPQAVEEAPVTQEQSWAEAPTPAPNPSAYVGKLYHYCRAWMPLSDWIAGGGSEFSYNWRPSLNGSVPEGYESQLFEKNGSYS